MDSSLISVLANLGTGGVVIVLIILGYLVPKPTHARVLQENEKLQAALDLERQRSDAAAAAGATVASQVIGGLVRLAGGHPDEGHAPDGAALHPPPLDLTGKDIGL